MALKIDAKFRGKVTCAWQIYAQTEIKEQQI